MLFIRSGWKETYDSKSDEENSKAALRHGSGKGDKDGLRYAGVAQEEKMIDWLHDCYFATVAGDAPSFEAWPTQEGMYACIAFIVEDYESKFRALTLLHSVSSSRVYSCFVGYAVGRDA